MFQLFGYISEIYVSLLWKKKKILFSILPFSGAQGMPSVRSVLGTKINHYSHWVQGLTSTSLQREVSGGPSSSLHRQVSPSWACSGPLSSTSSQREVSRPVLG